ncbi:MAG: DUF4097 domain-containing protein [bacterium]|nr:DUF4097 domain-containing protein [bacterium]
MKRFWVTVLILFACTLLFFVGSGVILALAPGTDIFGVSYVSAWVGKNTVEDSWNDLINGDITIETRTIPVVINFEPYTKTSVVFKQNYSGYTTDTERVPNAIIERNASGVTVKTSEVNKFAIGRNTADSNLTITLPLVWANGTHSIYIKSDSSVVTINAREESIVKLNTLSVDVNSSVNFKCKLNATNLILNSRNKTTLTEDLRAENIDYTTNAGDLIIDYDCDGTVKFNSNSGSLKFKSIRNLVASTKGGSILPNGETNTVISKAEVETKRGKINIDYLPSTLYTSEIKTNTGTINIKLARNVKITAPKARVNVESIYNGEIAGGSKQVTVGNVSGELTVSSTLGKIVVGGLDDTKKVKSVNATSTRGRIEVYNTSGKVEITTNSGDVYLVNNSSNNITIEGAKNVIAVGLAGAVNVKATRTISLSFDKFTNDVNVVCEKNCKRINIAVPKKLSELKLNLSSTGKKGIVNIYEGKELTKSEQTIEQEGTIGLTVSATKCPVNIYLDK